MRVLSVAYEGVSVPLMWTVLGKKGNSSTQERIALIERFLRRFPPERIECLTADREFRGHRGLAYLIQRGIRFRLRIPNHTKTHNRHRNAHLPVTRLFSVQIGETLVLNRPRRLWGHTLYLVATRARAPNGEHVIVITTHAPEHALEDTPVTDPDRVARLVAVITLVPGWCYKVGLWLDQQQPIVIKKHQRRACSVIPLGLDTWRRALLNGASQTRQIRYWIHFLFNKKVTIANT